MDDESIKFRQETKEIKDKLQEMYLEWDKKIAEVDRFLARIN